MEQRNYLHTFFCSNSTKTNDDIFSALKQLMLLAASLPRAIHDSKVLFLANQLISTCFGQVAYVSLEYPNCRQVFKLKAAPVEQV